MYPIIFGECTKIMSVVSISQIIIFILIISVMVTGSACGEECDCKTYTEDWGHNTNQITSPRAPAKSTSSEFLPTLGKVVTVILAILVVITVVVGAYIIIKKGERLGEVHFNVSCFNFCNIGD
jgi:L-asparagine transporter-like permease